MTDRRRVRGLFVVLAVLAGALSVSAGVAPPAAALTGPPVFTEEPPAVVYRSSTFTLQVSLSWIAEASGDPSAFVISVETSTDGGQSWIAVTGASSGSGTSINGGIFLWEAVDGVLFRAIATNAGGTATSRTTKITVCDETSCVLPTFGVSPDHDLLSGELVVATASGLPADTELTLSTCIVDDPARCTGSSSYVSDGAGDLSATFAVTSVVYIRDCVVWGCEVRLKIGPEAVFGRAAISFLPPIPTVLPTVVSKAEANAGSAAFDLPVTLSNRSNNTVTVEWTTLFVPGAPTGQADPATDYTPSSGTVTFAPGETEKTVPLSINGDLLVESDEYFVVSFRNPTNAKIGGFYGLGLGVVANDDHATVLPGVASQAEGNSGTTDVQVSVTLSNPSTQTITVEWTTLFVPGAPTGQADPATDYTPSSGTVTFAPGETAKTVQLSVNGDLLVESDEYVIVSFHDPTNAKMGGFWGLGLGVVANDD